MQSLYRSNQKPVDSAHRVTPTLIALIVLFTILVTPSNVIAFVKTASGSYRTFETAARLANFFLLANFSVNFVLYLIINAEFRRAARDLVACRRCTAAGRRGDDDAGCRATFDGGGGGRSRRWRTELASQRSPETHQQEERVGLQRNPNTIVTGEMYVCNVPETEIAL